jgi:hypothetical protein
MLVINFESDPTKKDDLECLGYILSFFFLGGKLWDNFKDKDKNSMDKLIEKAKLHLTPELFCEKMPSNDSLYQGKWWSTSSISRVYTLLRSLTT